MSLRSFGDTQSVRKANNGKKTSGRLREATIAVTEFLEKRQLLNAQVINPTSAPVPTTAPLAPMPSKTFYVSGNVAGGNAWTFNSAITPVTTNDLVLNVQAFSQNYAPCCEADNGLGGIGCTGSINAGRLLTNGLTQNQVGNFPGAGVQAAATGSGSFSDSSSPMSVLSNNNVAGWFLEYNLGNYGNGSGTGATPSANGYDISEIDVLAGHQDTRTGMQVDIQVQFQGGNTTDWFSLSAGGNFSFTHDQVGTTVARGNAQMAITNNGVVGGGNIATHVTAVKFVASNQQTWFRELVVIGTPSPAITQLPTAPPAIAQLDSQPPVGRADAIFTIPTQANSDIQNSTNYSIQRAQVINGVTQAFTTIGGVSQNTSGTPITFADGGVQAGNNTYVYRVLATDPFGTATGPVSNGVVTLPVSAQAHYYNEAFWTGPVYATQGVVQVGLSNGGSWFSGIAGSQDSAVVTGKVTTNAAGVYTFISNTDDDGWLYVDGVLVSFDPGGHGQRDAGLNFDINNQPIGTVIPISLAANTSYDFVMMEHNAGGGAAANMLWITPSFPGTFNRQLVPTANLSPISDHVAAPSAPTVLGSPNANFVNFTFTANNQGVVDYILQRRDVTDPLANNPWVTVSTTWPVGNRLDASSVSTGIATVTIQDAHPIPGASYTYRVAAENYDGAVYSTTNQATLATAPDVISPPGTPLTLTAAPQVANPAGPAALGESVSHADSSLTPGATYFVEYTWNSSAGGQTAGSAESSIVFPPSTVSAGYLQVTLPTLPVGAANANVYIGTASGGEHLAGTVAGGGTTNFKAVPASTAASVPVTNTSASMPAGTYFVEYSWLNSPVQSGASAEQSVVLSVPGAISAAVPNLAANAGARNANVYVSSTSGAEKLSATVNGGQTLWITSMPTTTAAPTTSLATLTTTSDSSGLAAGTYFVKYTWTNSAFVTNSGSQGETAASEEQSIVLTAQGDVNVVLPVAPTGAVNGNVYVSSQSGQERLYGTVNGSPASLPVKQLFNTTKLAPTTTTAGLAPGTYFAAFTWLGNNASGTGMKGETAPGAFIPTSGLFGFVTDEASIVLTSRQDLTVANFGSAPAAGVSNVNVYVGTASGNETLQTLGAGTTGWSAANLGTLGIVPTSTLTLNTLTQPVNVSLLPVNANNAGAAAIMVNTTANLSNATGTVAIPSAGTISPPLGLEIHMYNGRLLAGAGSNTSTGSGNVLGFAGSPVANNPGWTGGINGVESAFLVPQAGGQDGYSVNYNAAIALGIPVNASRSFGPTEFLAQTSVQSLSTFLPGVIDRDYNAQLPTQPGAPIVQSPDAVKYPDISRVQWEDFTQTFTGKVTVGFSGMYTILSNTDDSGFVWINGTLVSADPGGHGQQDALFPAVTICGATNAQPIQITTNNPIPAYAKGMLVNVSGVGGDTNANGNWFIKVVDSNHAQLFTDGSLQPTSGVKGNGNFSANGVLTLGSLSNSPGGNNGTTGGIQNAPNRGGDTLVPVMLQPNQSYDLTMMMQNVGGGAGAHLRWIEPRIIDHDVIAGASGLFNGSGDTATVTLTTGNVPSYSLVGYTLFITSGTGRGQNASILSWDSNTRTAIVNVVSAGSNLLWTTLPNTTSGYAVALYEPIPVAGTDQPGGPIGQPGITAGGLTLYQDVPTQSSWNPNGNTITQVGTTSTGSAAGPLAITGVDPRTGVTLTWSDQSNSELWFEIQRSTDGTHFSSIGTTPFDIGTSYTDITAANAFNSNISYFYKVRGVNFDGAGPFTQIVSTTNGLIVAPPTITAIIQGAPGTAGLVFGNPPGSAVDTGGLDIQYAPVTSGSTGTFIDATPVALPTTTFDYQVTNSAATPLSASQQYVFKARFTTSANNSNAALFGSVVPFTPSGGVTENFGSPGTGTAAFTSLGDLVINGNASLTGAGIPTLANPTTGAQVGAFNDVPVPTALATLAGVADIPLPSVAGGLHTVPNNSALSGGFTYFLEYTWVNGAGQETTPSIPTTIALPGPSTAGYDVSYILPSPAPAGVANANVYVGTSSLASQELRFSTGVAAGSTQVVRSLPLFGSVTAPTQSNAGMPNGTYFVKYSWLNPSSQETTASPEASVVVNSTTGSNDITIVLPSFPNISPMGVATSANVFLSSVTNTETLSFNQSTNNATATVRSLPTNPQTPQTTNGVGMPAGTYFLTYTWTSTEPNSTGNPGGESQPAPLVNVTLAANQDVGFIIPGASGSQNTANIYLSSSASATPIQSGTLFTANATGSVGNVSNSTAPQTLFVRALPTSGNNPPQATPATGTFASSVAVGILNPATAPGVSESTFGSSSSSLSPNATYFVEYTWLANGGETAASPEASFAFNSNSPTGTLDVTIPTAPAGAAANANVYIGTASGGEHLFGQEPAGTTTSLNGPVPSSTAALAPSTSTTGLPAGTYYVEFTWNDSANSVETAASAESTVIATNQSNIITVQAGPSPTGSGAAQFYVSSVSGKEGYLGGATGPANTLTFSSLPTINAKLAPTTTSTVARYFTPANALKINDNNNNQNASVFNLGENVTTFSTSFDFQLSGQMAADGLAFVIQDNAQNATGGGGGSLGYAGGFNHSVAILLSTYPNNNHGSTTALAINGTGPADSTTQTPATGFSPTNTFLDLTKIGGVPTGIQFTGINNGNNAFSQRAGDIYNVAISYDNSTHILNEKVTDLTLKNAGVPNGYATSYSIDLVSILGMPAAYVGFTAASGGAAVEKDILNWNFTNTLTTINFPADVINGTPGVDTITLKQDATDHTRLDWTMNTVNANVINQLSISDTNGLTINGLGSNDVITLDYTNGNPLPNKVHLNGVFSVNGLQNSIGLNNTTLDIEHSRVYLNYGAGPSPISLVQSYLANGYNGGNWNGTPSVSTGVIDSSSLPAAAGFGVGYADSASGVVTGQPANSVELLYTLVGDVNLDGSVNFNDLGILGQNYLTTGKVWTQGDLNYDGSVNFNDLGALGQNFNQSFGISAAPATASPAAASATNSSNLGLPSGTTSGTNSSSSSSNSSGSSKGHSAKPAATSGHKKNKRNKHNH